MRSLRLLFIALLVPGLLGSFSTLSRRIAVEKADRNVQIALDLDEVQSLASRPGSPGLTDVLTELKNSGVTSIAVTQSTIGSYLNIGAARLEPVSTDGALRYQIVCDSALISRVIREALRSGGFLSEEPQRRGSSQQGTTIGPLSLPPAEIARLPLGFDTQSQILGQIRRLGFSVVGRVNNFSEVNDSFLGFLAKQMQAFNIEKVIFAGDEVLGWNGGVKQTAEWFERSHLIFGNIEFSKQKGSDKLGTLLKGRYIRVHSISGSEMANYQQPAAVERFVRAARERNVRLLYIRLIEMSGPTALENNASYIHEIVSGLRKSGYRPGAASIIGDPHPLRWELLLMAIALAAGVILVLTEFVDLKPGAAGAAFGITVVVLFAAVFAGDVGRKGLALLSALVFPVWGLARTVRLVNQLPEAVRIPAILRSLQLLVLYLSAIVCAVYGGVLIAAILSGRLFMTETSQFAGVKLAHLLPVVVVAFAAIAGLLGEPLAWKEMKTRMAARVREAWQTPVLFGYGFVALVALVVLLVVVVRSGNDAGVGVSPLELRFRAVLDQILFVRPRSKEILVGYPALVAALWLSLQRQRAWASFFFVLAMVGLVSALNSFCHIHTPLEITVVRVINGAWVGLVTGAVLIWLLRRLGLGADSKVATDGPSA